MIHHVWPGDIPGRRSAVQGDWFNMSFDEGSFDVALGDGILTGVPYPKGYGAFAARVRQWLRPAGRLILRNFSAGANAEPLDHVLDDLRQSRIPRFDVFKWRLAMSLQTDATTGVVLDNVHRAWNRIANTTSFAAAIARWPRESVATVDLYAGRTNRYAFPTLEELDAAFAPHLDRISVTLPSYELGECCPIVVYAPAPASA
jgi:hypothetical protein